MHDRDKPAGRGTARGRVRAAALLAVGLSGWACAASAGWQEAPVQAAPVYPNDAAPMPADLDSWVRGAWWEADRPSWTGFLDVPRDETVAFAVYTRDRGVLKLSAQLFPLKPGEPREVVLEIDADGDGPGGFAAVARAPVIERGWSAHFRVETAGVGWSGKHDAFYRVRHGGAEFAGTLRRTPRDDEWVVVGTLSCNSNADRGDRDGIVRQLLHHDPDLLFFAGDQSYDHKQHTTAWLKWGTQFREALRDRPVVTIVDDHDIGQGNIWGEGGIKSANRVGNAGGYVYDPSYINMVERQQTWHLPDPAHAEPIAQGITTYYTHLRVGRVSFAIIEDRKFKSGPAGKIPPMGPRPDHINDPSYDPGSVDVDGLQLLGERQTAFLREWAEDWSGVDMKVVLSQTNFCGAVHLHGSRENRLLADLDSNGWPQTPRREALRVIRSALASHLAGDQHLAVVTRHGIDRHRDGPFSFVNPAIVNTYYGRWWHPEDELPGRNPVPGSPLPWTGDYTDGLGNKITMLAYANPDAGFDRITAWGERDAQSRVSTGRADGYGIARYHPLTGTTVFEAWPRDGRPEAGDGDMYPGWPVVFNMTDNDGRTPVGTLPAIDTGGEHASVVVQVINESTGEVLYTRRAPDGWRPRVYSMGPHTVRLGVDQLDAATHRGVHPVRVPDGATLGFAPEP